MTSFVDAVKMFYSRYVDFAGRSSRSQYWWIQLFFILVYVVLGTLAVLLGGGFENLDSVIDGGNGSLPIGTSVMFGLIGLFVLANIIPGIALIVRRFHDLGQSGWLYLLFIVLGLIPLIGLLVSLGMLIWFCLRGTVGPNKFGPDPLGDTGDIFN